MTDGIFRKNIEKLLEKVNFIEIEQPTTNVVHPGIISKTSALSVIANNSTWIINISASDHMEKDPSNLNFSNPSSLSVIRTANSSTSLIIGEGSVILNDSLTLDTVIVV